jgi:hypothetical protein
MYEADKPAIDEESGARDRKIKQSAMLSASK